jgi:hypothetical protein
VKVQSGERALGAFESEGCRQAKPAAASLYEYVNLGWVGWVGWSTEAGGRCLGPSKSKSSEMQEGRGSVKPPLVAQQERREAGPMYRRRRAGSNRYL